MNVTISIFILILLNYVKKFNFLIIFLNNTYSDGYLKFNSVAFKNVLKLSSKLVL